ncbi:hypothetical protein BC829DRAFT_5793 [Chytridium lagenaria]|nr:hypothetical protein BC829DRAFT_5793 [Chytridium lagenaria]
MQSLMTSFSYGASQFLLSTAVGAILGIKETRLMNMLAEGALNVMDFVPLLEVNDANVDETVPDSVNITEPIKMDPWMQSLADAALDGEMTLLSSSLQESFNNDFTENSLSPFEMSESHLKLLQYNPQLEAALDALLDGDDDMTTLESTLDHVFDMDFKLASFDVALNVIKDSEPAAYNEPEKFTLESDDAEDFTSMSLSFGVDGGFGLGTWLHFVHRLSSCRLTSLFLRKRRVLII